MYRTLYYKILEKKFFAKNGGTDGVLAITLVFTKVSLSHRGLGQAGTGWDRTGTDMRDRVPGG